MNRRSGNYILTRTAQYALAVLISLFMLAPLYLIALAAFSTNDAIYAYPKSLLPGRISFDTVLFFWNAGGVKASLVNSIVVGLITLLLALLIGAPAGYALARYVFRGRDVYKMVILTTRAFPMVILAIPLTVNFIKWGLYDTRLGLALVHTAMAMPTTVLVTSSIFLGVSVELEEAAETLGCSRFGAFLRVSLPLALPGLAAAAIFAFVLSWNEVFAAAILTQNHRTLPALVLSQIASAGASLPFRFAAGFFLVAPALLFILFMRRYLLGMWGQVVK